jgi:hypothetical protein
MDAWRLVFEGPVGARVARVEVYGDGEAYRVRTTQLRDFEDPSIPLVKSAGEPLDIHGENLAELRKELLVKDFSEAEALEVLRAFGPDPLVRYAFDSNGARVRLQGHFGDGTFSVMQIPNGSKRVMRAAGSDQASGGIEQRSIVATNLNALQAAVEQRFPGFSNFRQF